jgi:hypothetical protein
VDGITATCFPTRRFHFPNAEAFGSDDSLVVKQDRLWLAFDCDRNFQRIFCTEPRGRRMPARGHAWTRLSRTSRIATEKFGGPLTQTLAQTAREYSLSH